VCVCAQEMTSEALRRVVVEYIKAVMQKRITFKNADERREGAERMIKEAEQFKFLFRKLAAVSPRVTVSPPRTVTSTTHTYIENHKSVLKTSPSGEVEVSR